MVWQTEIHGGQYSTDARMISWTDKGRAQKWLPIKYLFEEIL